MSTRHIGAQSVQQVLGQAPALARLTELLAQSRARLAAIAPLVPGPMRAALQPGPIDALPEGGVRWLVLAANAGVAAKLRQLRPLMLQRLEAAGLAVAEIKVQVQAQAPR